MDQELRKIINAEMPKLNPVLAGGIACVQVPQAERYVDEIWKAVARTWPSHFRYMGGTRCTPVEAFEHATKKKESKRTYDVARSDLFLMKYTFELSTVHPERGTEMKNTIERYVYLPFCRDGGEIFISGSRYFISPVIADKVISKSSRDIFIRLIRARLTFEELMHDYMVYNPGSGWIRQSAMVTWSKIYHGKHSETNVKTCVPHYLFCKYGFSEAFRRFAGVVPAYGYEDTVNEHTHPFPEWTILKSSGINPNSRKKVVIPSNVRIAIPSDQLDTNEVLSRMISGFFYVLDNFPERIKPVPEYLENTRLWRIVLGHLVQDTSRGDGPLADSMNEHMQSLDEYVDEVMKKRFAAIGYEITDAYEMLALIEKNISTWLLEGGQTVNSLYGKELNILNFLLTSITEAINNFNFKLMAKLARKKELTVKDVEDLMATTIRPGLIFSISKNNSEVSPGAVPGDNMAFKMTTMMIPQANSSKGSTRNTGKAQPETLLHISVAEHAGYGNMPKKFPDGRARLNPYTLTAPDGSLLKNPDLYYVTERVQNMLSLETGEDA